jgi:flagellar P-ring protein precursor FlgI
VSLPTGTTVADLVSALNRIKSSTRDIIAILQGIKRSGALHAELVIQ